MVPLLLVPDDPGVTGAVTTKTSRSTPRLSLSRTKAEARRRPSAVERALACSPIQQSQSGAYPANPGRVGAHNLSYAPMGFEAGTSECRALGRGTHGDWVGVG